ncbi:TetR/AcrR family transcriptional regulator [Dysgonomonadaceae bacterium PH5-43]|nr:TetR/AcrR family transcriptional regulator [Dysgonomonadaceae bacterium PH5-43]
MNNSAKQTEINMEEKILDVAENLFLDKGFNQTSTTLIAKEAGCNHAMVHYYFRTKENLFLRIFKKKISLFATAFFCEDNSVGSFEEKLAKRIGCHFDMITQNPKLPMLILSELVKNPDRITLARTEIGNVPYDILKLFDKELKEEIAKGNVRNISSQDLFLNIISLNVFSFLALPVIDVLLEIPERQKLEFIKHRREEIIETILKSIML